MLSLEALSQQVNAGEIETVVVAFTDLYGRPLGKRFEAGFFWSRSPRRGRSGATTCSR